jgi:hypothetical protein
MAASTMAAHSIVAAWPRDRAREQAFRDGTPLPLPAPFEKAHAVPATVRHIGVAPDATFATIDFDDVDGKRYAFRITINDALTVARAFSSGRPYHRGPRS